VYGCLGGGLGEGVREGEGGVILLLEVELRLIDWLVGWL
jgi:hypothetical protein